METDYSCFEALFEPEIMEACEFQLYDYMTSRLPEHDEFMAEVSRTLAGVNVCKFKWFRVHIRGKRMSGEMCTSLGNGFTNLMLMLFICSEKGCTDVTGVVEGDDGLFGMRGTLPTAADFAELGFVIKIKTHESLSTASFCGIIFDPEDKINITDAVEALTTFGWGPRRYMNARGKKRMMLLRCKALSMAHQYPGCPVLQEAAHSILRGTRQVKYYIGPWLQRGGALAFSLWERDQVLAALRDEEKIKKITIPIATRLLYEKQFRVTVEHQIGIENQFATWTGQGKHMPRGLLDIYLENEWTEFWEEYVRPRSEHLDLPRGPFATAADFRSA
jgi:hypothetical protein